MSSSQRLFGHSSLFGYAESLTQPMVDFQSTRLRLQYEHFSKKINSESISRTYPLLISPSLGETSAYLPQLGKMSRSDRRGISVATFLRLKNEHTMFCSIDIRGRLGGKYANIYDFTNVCRPYLRA